MSVFDAAVRAIFADANMAVSATYTPQGGDPVTLRAVRRASVEQFGFDGAQISSATVSFMVQRASLAAPAAGDTITVGGVTRIVQGAPELDSEELVWTLDTRPA